MDAELIKWAIAFGGWVVAIFTVWLGYRERQDAREEDMLREALSYFTGGTQKRSIGLAFLEGKFRHDARFREIWIPVISNQFVYLLVQTDSDEEAHEKRNLVRMYRLLNSVPDFRSNHSGSYGDTLDAIGQKLEGEDRGLNINHTTLEMWRENLEKST